MSILEAVLVCFLLASPGIWSQTKDEFARPITWQRQMIKEDCLEWKKNPHPWSVGGLVLSDEVCRPPRWGVERQWWERRTIEEMRREHYVENVP